MNCPGCQKRLGVVKTVPLRSKTWRLLECEPCGMGFESEEKVTRRLPVTTGNHGQPARNGPATTGNPPATVGGFGGRVSSGSDSDPDLNLESSVLSEPRARTRNKRRAAPEASAEFDRFWSRWPRRVCKDAAINAWNNATAESRDVQRIEAIHRALDWQAPEFERREASKIPHAATWLNNRRWTDERPQPASVTPIKPVSADPPWVIAEREREQQKRKEQAETAAAMERYRQLERASK